MDSSLIKFQVGLLLAKRGIRTFSKAADAIGVSLAHLSNVLACRERNPRVQLGLARLCGRTPAQIFGTFVHPTLKELE